jgi:hypothetical protein
MDDPYGRKLQDNRLVIGELFLAVCWALGINRLVAWLAKRIRDIDERA